MRALLCAVLFIGLARAADAPLREVQSECPVNSEQPVCEFRHGRLFRFDPVMRVYGRDGRFAFNAPVRFPNGDLAQARDADVDSDGSIVVAAADYQKNAYGLAVLNATGMQTALFPTGSFAPRGLAIAEDHSIWVLGSEGRKGDYMVLRKYTREGKLTGSFLPRSTLAPGLDPSGIAVRAAGNRIAVIAFSGTTSNLRDVVEFDATGKMLGRMRLDRADMTAFALTSDGNLYTWDQTLMPYGGLVLLEPVTGSSEKLESPGHYYSLLGADGENLVYRGPGNGDTVSEFWFPQPGANH